MGTDNANKDRQAIDLLFAERCSCVVRNGDTIRIFRERGVRDLWRLLHEEPELLDGAFVADKVVGKGAAALMAAGRVRELFADVVSHAALELLNGAGIPVTRSPCPTSSTASETASVPWSGSAPERGPPRSACR